MELVGWSVLLALALSLFEVPLAAGSAASPLVLAAASLLRRARHRDRADCDVLLYDLPKDAVEGIILGGEEHRQEESNAFSALVVSTRNLTSRSARRTSKEVMQVIRTWSRCTLAVAHVQKAKRVHAMTAPSFRKRVILLQDQSGDQLPALSLDHRMLHPPILLSEDIHARVLCQPEVAIAINYFLAKGQPRWLMPVDITSEQLERYCNNGKEELEGREVSFAIINAPGVTIVDEQGRPVSGGVEVPTIRLMQRRFGLVPSMSYDPRFLEFVNGSLGGIIGHVLSGKVDFASYVPFRAELISLGMFSFLPVYENWVFIEPFPRELSAMWNTLRPLDSLTWLFFLLASAATALGLCCLMTTKNKWINIGLALDVSFGAVFQEYNHQGAISAASRKARWLVALWVVVSMVVTLSYAGNLKASLIQRPLEPRTLRFSGMVDDKSAPIHIPREFYDWVMAFPHDGDVLVAAATQAKNLGTIREDTDGKDPFFYIDLVERMGGYTGMLYESTLNIAANSYRRKGSRPPFLVLPEKLSVTFGAFHRRYDPWAELLLEAGVQEALMDCGLANRMLAEAIGHQMLFDDLALSMRAPDGDRDRPIGLAEIALAGYMLAAGLGAASVALSAEVWRWLGMAAVLRSLAARTLRRFRLRAGSLPTGAWGLARGLAAGAARAAGAAVTNARHVKRRWGKK